MNYREPFSSLAQAKLKLVSFGKGVKKQAFSFILDRNQIGTELKSSSNFIKIENTHIL